MTLYIYSYARRNLKDLVLLGTSGFHIPQKATGQKDSWGRDMMVFPLERRSWKVCRWLCGCSSQQRDPMLFERGPGSLDSIPRVASTCVCDHGQPLPPNVGLHPKCGPSPRIWPSHSFLSCERLDNVIPKLSSVFYFYLLVFVCVCVCTCIYV